MTCGSSSSADAGPPPIGVKSTDSRPSSRHQRARAATPSLPACPSFVVRRIAPDSCHGKSLRPAGHPVWMRVDLMATPMPLARMQALARDAAAAGFSGLVITEAGRTAYLGCAAAALAAPDLDILTGVAVAFPRSPMVTAQVAWELAEATGGRFRLGLGTQVRAHVERRYGMEFDPPGPRMRDYVLALRAIFKGFRGEPLGYEGDYWDLSLLPAMWSPGPIDVADPPIDVAAVNPWMLRLAGEVADGLHVHPLNNPTYLEQTVLPELTAGAARAGRPVDDLDAHRSDLRGTQHRVARDGAHAGVVLRVDAQLRVPVRAARSRGNDRQASREAEGG